MLDFARYDATRDDSLTLMHSGEALGPGSLANPVVVVANYVFDAIPHDLFRARAGALEEGLVDAEEIQFAPLAEGVAAYPDDPDLSAVVEEYRRELREVTFLIPVSAIHAVQRLNALSRGGMLLLAGDKGYWRTEQFRLFGETPHVTRHGPVVWVDVNFHALKRYFARTGGTLLLPSDPATKFVVATGVLGLSPGEQRATRVAHADAVDGLPLIDHSTLLNTPAPESAGFEHLLALLRVCEYDPAVVLRHAEAFTRGVDHPDPETVERLVQALERVHENFFPVGPEDAPVPRRLGQLLFVAGRPELALGQFQQALELDEPGQRAGTLFNVALCHRAIGQADEAERALDEAARLDPSDWRIPAVLSQLRAAAQ
jgi:hypothetical protein